GYAFLGQPDAGEVLANGGSPPTEAGVGGGPQEDFQGAWFVVLRHESTGDVKDDETVGAAGPLQTIPQGAEEGNKGRGGGGMKPFFVDDWSEPPHYDRAAHHLVWALDLHDDESTTVNFNTRILGRRGVVSINLVTAPEDLARDKHHAAALLEATTFDPGARYSDFDPRSDKVAEFGLVGLILGGVGVAKLAKVGILAAFWKWILT